MDQVKPDAVDRMESAPGPYLVARKDHSTPRPSYSQSDLDALLAEERDWQADQASPQEWK